MPFLGGTIFGNYGIISIQFQQSGNVPGVMGIHFETRRIWNHHIMNLIQCDKSSIFILFAIVFCDPALLCL